MKQNFPTARQNFQRVGVYLIVLLANVFLSAACATLPTRVVDTSQASFRDSTAGTSPRININSASAQQLETLPGIGKVIAERIVEHRNTYGSFRRAEHLMMVRGISEQKFHSLRSLITAE